MNGSGCQPSDRAILGNKLHHANPRELVLRMDSADPPPTCRKLHGSLFRLATTGILHSEIRAGHGRVHQHRRAISDPQAAVLPWSVRVGNDCLRSGEQFFLRIRSQPSHEDQLLRQEAGHCGFIGQDKRRRSLRAHGDHASPVVDLASPVIIITATVLAQDGSLLRAPAPCANAGLGDHDQRTAHRADPGQLSAVTAIRFKGIIHARSLPLATDTGQRLGGPVEDSQPGHRTTSVDSLNLDHIS